MDRQNCRNYKRNHTCKKTKPFLHRHSKRFRPDSRKETIYRTEKGKRDTRTGQREDLHRDKRRRRLCFHNRKQKLWIHQPFRNEQTEQEHPKDHQSEKNIQNCKEIQDRQNGLEKDLKDGQCKIHQIHGFQESDRQCEQQRYRNRKKIRDLYSQGKGHLKEWQDKDSPDESKSKKIKIS